jgi:lipid-binding SYLF domain-containing protein
MFKIRTHTAALLLLWTTTFFIPGCAGTPTRDEVQSTVSSSRTTLSNFLRDPDMTWLHRHLREAKGVLVSPRIIQAGFIIGGAGGPVVALARGRERGWNGPAFYKIAVGSIGFQAGAEESEMVALVMTDKGMRSLLSTSFKLGADVSLAAGPIGAGAGAPVTADIVTFVRTKGLYAGLNLSGTVISVDDERNRAYYGQDTSPVAILVEGRVNSPDAAPLVRVLERADRAAERQQ